MTSRRGFALAVVLAALIVMSLVLAIAARRALAAAQQAHLELARVELGAALAAAQAQALMATVDSGAVRLPPGVRLAEGEVGTESASARWTLTTASPPFVVAELRGSVVVRRGAARRLMRALLVPAADSASEVKWRLFGGGGWVRLPAP